MVLEGHDIADCVLGFDAKRPRVVGAPKQVEVS
jgi:hypothetical protein